MENQNQGSELQNLYGVSHIDTPMRGYEKTHNKPAKKSPLIFHHAWQHIIDKLSIDFVVKEITFAFIAFTTLVYMQYIGKTQALDDLGIIVQSILAFAGFYNLFKASIKSLFPGIFCMAFGLFLTKQTMFFKIFHFITPYYQNIIIGIGAFFIAISLIKSSSN